MSAHQGFVSQAAMVAALGLGSLATSMGAAGLMSASTSGAAGDGIAPLAQALDVRKRRQLRQRALYSVMFHNSQNELVNNIKAHVISADVYLAGASDVIQPYPKAAATT